MTLGQRCDEIVRLIDETLSACEAAPLVPDAAAALRPRAAAPAHGADLAEVLPRSA